MTICSNVNTASKLSSKTFSIGDSSPRNTNSLVQLALFIYNNIMEKESRSHIENIIIISYKFMFINYAGIIK